MWPAKPKPTQRGPADDPVEWARKETWTFTVWKCKVYGLLLGSDFALLILLTKGMPLHMLWRWLGIPVGLAFVVLFAAFGFYATAALTEAVAMRQDRRRFKVR
jgi:hypothetical protein